ncbi:GNTI, partial [Symbiodinium sp. CCMP2456]
VVDATSRLLDTVERAQSGFAGKQTFPRLTAQHFLTHAADLTLPAHRPIPPGAVVGPGPLGESCARHCENQGQVCVDADIAAVAHCAPPLTFSFACSICDTEAATAAFPGQNRDTGRCGAQMPAPGAKLPAADCDAQASRVRRLCVCRRAIGSETGVTAPVRLLSPGRHFAREAGNTASGAVASGERLEAFAAAVARDRQGAKGLALSAFALAPAQGQEPPKELLLNIQNLFVLFLVGNMTSARPDLRALRRTTGMIPNNILVVHRGGASAAGIAEFGFRSLDLGPGARRSKKASLGFAGLGLREAAAAAAEVKASGIIVLEEGQALSSDFFIFHGQLLSMLQRDPTLWCVSAWNENAIAPYAADATVVLRTDWFSGVAWMVTVDLLEKEMLPKWQEGAWLNDFRRLFRGRQCLVPEVSRATLALGQGGEQPLSQSVLASIPLCSSSWVDLGSTERLTEKNYMRLFLSDWPGEGLARSTPLASLRPLADGRANSKGPYRLALKGRGREDANWKVVATFFGLLPEASIRVTYFGVLRLRWRDSILYLITAASPFQQNRASKVEVPSIVTEGLRSWGQLKSSILPMDPMLFFSLTAPFLRPPGGEVHAASATGKTCLETCLNYGLTCLDQDLLFINHCAALATIFKCRACEPGLDNAGVDQSGVCLFKVSASDLPGQPEDF